MDKEKKKSGVVKSTKEITRKNLEEYLKEIGWSIRFHGANTWRIYNHKGKCSVFAFSSDEENKPIYDLRTDGYKINRYNYHKPFGKGIKYSDGGVVCFVLQYCELSLIDGSCVSISANTSKGRNMAFISFYNHKK